MTSNPAMVGQAPKVVAASQTPNDAPQKPIEKKKVEYAASIYPGPNQPIPSVVAESILALQESLGMPVWLLVQNSDDAWGYIGARLYRGFQSVRNSIPKRVAILIESPGGDAHIAYKIARLFQRRCDEFVVAVPQYAKSAATLLAMGASRLLMARDAELGPLDVQLLDREREELGSALDAVQALERLQAFAMYAVDQMVPFVCKKSSKKVETVVPWVLSYVTTFVRPLLEKIDTVDFTKKARELKIAEDYAIRLLGRGQYDLRAAKNIAGQLVEKYPTHGFVIDRDESRDSVELSSTELSGLGLEVEDFTSQLEEITDKILDHLNQDTIIGAVEPIGGLVT